MYMRRLPLCLVQRGTASFRTLPQVSVNVRRRVSSTVAEYIQTARLTQAHSLHARLLVLLWHPGTPSSAPPRGLLVTTYAVD